MSLLRMGEACKKLGIARVTAYRWIKAGILPAIRLPSGEFRLDEADLDTLLLHGKLTARTTRQRKMPKR
jgi:excisionase family DNA binding protein